jgi:hypothetical protein
LTFDKMDGEIGLFATPVNNRTPRQIIEQYIQKNYRTAQTAYQIPNAMVGYEPGYGEVDDFSVEDPNAEPRRARLLVMTSVKNRSGPRRRGRRPDDQVHAADVCPPFGRQHDDCSAVGQLGQ